VSQDCLKLTSYFGERQRGPHGFAADALLDLYGQHQIATSLLLRGVEGFGARQRPRTDRSLTLSEDLPLAAIAVDSRARIQSVLDPTIRLLGTGLVTMERARLLSDELGAAALGEELAEPTKLTLYLGRQERVRRVPAYRAVCDVLHRAGLPGATALLGVDGTVRGQRERAEFFSRNAATPVMLIAVGSGEQVAQVLPELGAMLPRPLLTLERVRICKRDGLLLGPPIAPEPPGAGGQPSWHKLMVYTSEVARYDGQPIHRVLIRRLRAAGISGATTLRGVWGFHGDHLPHGDRLLQLGRRVPAVSVVIDTADRIATAFGVIDELTARQGLVTCEVIPALHLTGTGDPQARLAR
jgi:PII-like signaling protein